MAEPKDVEEIAQSQMGRCFCCVDSEGFPWRIDAVHQRKWIARESIFARYVRARPCIGKRQVEIFGRKVRNTFSCESGKKNDQVLFRALLFG